MNLSTIDLNLLLVLDALASTGSVTATSRRLRRTQPAISNALARLRTTLDDPLFVRQGRGLVPTPRTQALAPLVREALQRLEGALAGDAPFNPATARGELRLAMSDYWHQLLVPRLFDDLARAAPGLELVPLAADERDAVMHGLARGHIDLAIFLAAPPPPGFLARPIVRDDYAVVLRRDHPIRRLTTRSLARLDEVVLVPRGMASALGDAHLDGAPRRRMATRSLTVVCQTVAASDRFAILPARIARAGVRHWPLRALPLPGVDTTLELDLHWHGRLALDPLHRWLRDHVGALARRLYGQLP